MIGFSLFSFHTQDGPFMVLIVDFSRKCPRAASLSNSYNMTLMYWAISLMNYDNYYYLC